MTQDFEAIFREFVKDFGGELLSEGEAKSADFYFPDANMVTELKTLENEALMEHAAIVQKLADSWMRRRLLFAYGRVMISLPKLHPICQREWLAELQPPVENIVRKANRQIRSSKQSMNHTDSKGLLLIANEGNLLHTSPVDYMTLVGGVLSKKDQSGERRFPHIDGVVYFSRRIRSRDEGFPFWVSGYVRPGGDPALSAFQERLQRGWFAYISKITGLPVGEFEVKLKEDKP